MTPISHDITKGLETRHICNELEFNSLLGACVEEDCGYHGTCKKYPSKKIRHTRLLPMRTPYIELESVLNIVVKNIF